MSTGSGKSLFFHLPTSLLGLDSITLVIVPLISLRQDLLSRSSSFGIKSAEWDPINPPHSANLVLLTPESFFQPTFQEFLRRQISQKRLDRIYFDECHTILDSTSAFRPKVLELKRLPKYKIPLVFLTATLPPKNKLEFFTRLNIIPAKACILRENTTRKNIGYSVIKYSLKHEAESALQRIIQQKSTQYPPPNQILVFCGSVKITKYIGSLLDCPVYYQDVDPTKKPRFFMNYSIILARFSLVQTH